MSIIQRKQADNNTIMSVPAARPLVSFIVLLFLAVIIPTSEAGQCTGGHAYCPWATTEDECRTLYPFCEVNPDREVDTDSLCVHVNAQVYSNMLDEMVMCNDLDEDQCSVFSPQAEYGGGCAWETKSRAMPVVLVSLASLSVALLMVALYLIVKVTLAVKSSSNAGEVAGSPTEPLLESSQV